MKRVIVSGAFDDIRSRDVRFLQEASKRGPVHVLLWSDEDLRRIEGRSPRFPAAERRYVLHAVRFVDRVILSDGLAGADQLPAELTAPPGMWVVDARFDTPGKRRCCDTTGLDYEVLGDDTLGDFPTPPELERPFDASRKKVVATGCFDWLHSGHVRFFEELSGLGALFVVIGNDANLKLLKGPGHPLFPEDERRYMVQSIRHVHRALVATGSGWMDAAPQIEAIQPDIYAVNEDGDRPEKRAFCARHGIEYVVLRRTPAEGLPRRASTQLRGF